MPSFDVVNYSIRPNKSIQRSIIFECLQELSPILGLAKASYIGLGSIWFTDFQLAHKLLRIRNLVSIEKEKVGAKRAEFNKPFKTVSVKEGLSYDILPELLEVESNSPVVVWLDYDGRLDEENVQDLTLLAEGVPKNSVILFTFNAVPHKYGKPKNRKNVLEDLFGERIADEIQNDRVDDEDFIPILRSLTMKYLQSVVVNSGRVEIFLPAFSIEYRDGMEMLTIGGVLAETKNRKPVEKLISKKGWMGIQDTTIALPPLTHKEVLAMQSALPRRASFTRKNVNSLGFDLEDAQIQAFELYYKYYPSFAEFVL